MEPTLAGMSSFDLAATIAVGAVMGRAVLGYTPTLAAGVSGMATLLALQAAFGVLRRSSRLATQPDPLSDRSARLRDLPSRGQQPA
jgi:uncharacterized membrane protein YcaP (DUF421 family)